MENEEFKLNADLVHFLNMENKYTSLELSKKLKENGCDLESKYCYAKNYKKNNILQITSKKEEIQLGKTSEVKKININLYDWVKVEKPSSLIVSYSYDILWDICIKYADKFFGEKLVCANCGSVNIETSTKKFNECYNCHEAERDYSDGFFIVTYQAFELHTKNIIKMLQQNKKQEAEEYIWKYTLFNPINKEKKDNGK